MRPIGRSTWGYLLGRELVKRIKSCLLVDPSNPESFNANPAAQRHLTLGLQSHSSVAPDPSSDHPSSAAGEAVARASENFAAWTGILLARGASWRPTGAAAESTIVALGPTIPTIIVAARRSLRLRLWQLPCKRGPARKADFSVRRYFSHHDGDLIADVQHSSTRLMRMAGSSDSSDIWTRPSLPGKISTNAP